MESKAISASNLVEVEVEVEAELVNYLDMVETNSFSGILDTFPGWSYTADNMS